MFEYFIWKYMKITYHYILLGKIIYYILQITNYMDDN
jgi:hypothetical protein